MLLIMTICAALVMTPMISAMNNVSEEGEDLSTLRGNDTMRKEKYVMRTIDWFGDVVLGAFEVVTDDERSQRSNGSFEEGRKKKKKLNKYLAPLIVGFLLIKSILLPLVLKALAIMSGKAVVLSTMSLILAAILGLRGIAGGVAVKKSDTGHYNYRRRDYFNNHNNYRDKMDEDEFYQDYQDRFRDPYRYYSGNAKKR